MLGSFLSNHRTDAVVTTSTTAASHAHSPNGPFSHHGRPTTITRQPPQAQQFPEDRLADHVTMAAASEMLRAGNSNEGLKVEGGEVEEKKQRVISRSIVSPRARKVMANVALGNEVSGIGDVADRALPAVSKIADTNSTVLNKTLSSTGLTSDILNNTQHNATALEHSHNATTPHNATAAAQANEAKIQELEVMVNQLNHDLEHRLAESHEQSRSGNHSHRSPNYDRGFEVGFQVGFRQAFNGATTDYKQMYSFPEGSGHLVKGNGPQSTGAEGTELSAASLSEDDLAAATHAFMQASQPAIMPAFALTGAFDPSMTGGPVPSFETQPLEM